jgi:hypothetical protein
MIKFFRKIRQNLISQGKTGKYFKYAIGEIILVVIGIIIALQINNANELRKNKDEEAVMLSNIKEDFLATRSNFIKTIQLQERAILNCRDLINAIEAKDYTVHPDTIREKFRGGAYSYFTLKAITGSYEAVIGSGKTSIIRNKELLNVLANFSSQYNAGYEDQSKSDNLINLMMTESGAFFPALSANPFRNGLDLKKDYSLEEKKEAIKMLYENKAFLAYLLQKTRWERIRAAYQKELLKSLNKVLYQFDIDDLTPEKAIYHTYIGSYKGMVNGEERIFKINYVDESLYINTPNGSVYGLVQFNNSLFYTLAFNLKVDFGTSEDSENKLWIQFIDKVPIEFTKVEME